MDIVDVLVLITLLFCETVTVIVLLCCFVGRDGDGENVFFYVWLVV